MKTFEIIYTDSKSHYDAEDTRQTEFVFDDCFTMFDVYEMLKTYLVRHQMTTNFVVREVTKN